MRFVGRGWGWAGVAASGVAALSWIYGCRSTPEPPPPPTHAPFPAARVARMCGEARDYGVLPGDQVNARWVELAELDRWSLRIAICGAETRNEIAMAMAHLGLRALARGDDRSGLGALRYASDIWYDPMAHTELGLHYLASDPPDPARAWRYLAAGRAIAADLASHSGDYRLLQRIDERAAEALAAFDDPALQQRFDHRASSASVRRFVTAHRNAYRELYLDPLPVARNVPPSADR